MDSTFEEARRCPKCGVPGVFVKKEALRGGTRGAELHHYACENTRCKWHGTTCRVIQVNPDGSIPMPAQRDKQFPKVQDLSARVNEQLAEQVRIERDGHGEVSRR